MSIESNMLSIVTALALLSGSAAACGIDTKSLDSTWAYASDQRWVKTKSAPLSYHVEGLPEGITIVNVVYREPGLLVRGPDRGAWEFDKVGLLYYRGRKFALIGTAQGVTVDKDGHRAYLGCVTPLVIYDRSGSGRLDMVTDAVYAPGSGEKLHVPEWAMREGVN
jgi:hypothetical protein